MRRVPAASRARRPSSREAWVNAMGEVCDAIAWDMLTPEEREIDVTIDAWMARRGLPDLAHPPAVCSGLQEARCRASLKQR